MQVYIGKPIRGALGRNQGMQVDINQGLGRHSITCGFCTSYSLGQELLKLTMVGTASKNKPELPAELLSIKNRAPQSCVFTLVLSVGLYRCNNHYVYTVQRKAKLLH